MEKEICRRHLSREGTGCVWVFMNMFDFKHGGSNQKLLMDKKRGSKRIIGIEAKVEKQLTCDFEESEAGIQSVKKLIEEEIDDKTRQKCDFECRGGTKAKSRRKRSRNCSKTSEDINVLIAGGDDDHAEKSDDHQCTRISQDSTNDDDSEEKFSELIKRLIAQKESEAESCKNLVDDAFQVLDSREESFLTIDEPVSGDTQRIKETSSSNETRSSQCTQTIVILKPEPHNKAKNGRFGSRFILSRIRRRLKYAVGKNPCNNPDPYPDALSSHMSQKCCLGQEMKETRHVSGGEVLPEIASQSECNKENTIHDGSEDSKKSMCGIYVAAKKHLSEMLAEGDISVDSPDKETPRILGKILALPEFSTPETSPRLKMAHDFVGDHQITEESPNIQQCSSEDYFESETLGIDSNNQEETELTSDTPVQEGVSDNEKEEKIFLDSLSEAIRFSIIQQDSYVDEDKFEIHDKDEHKQLLEKETFDERHSPCSPPNSSVRMSECQENATDLPGKSSPVSVLEPLFIDDDFSPNSSRFSSAEMRMQPLCIRFDEPDSPKPDEDNDVKTRMDDKELALAYIEDVVRSSDLNWEELLSRSFYSEQILEQALMDDIDFCSTIFCSDKKLLFDCINEVLTELCVHGPWISFAKPDVRFYPDMEDAAEVVQEEVYWHLFPLPSPHTLDQIVHKDFARTGTWMDLRFDIGCIGSETGETILDELLEEIISNCTDLFQAETVNETTVHNMIP